MATPPPTRRRRARIWMLLVALVIGLGAGVWLLSRHDTETASIEELPPWDVPASAGADGGPTRASTSNALERARLFRASFAGADGYFIRRVDGGTDAGMEDDGGTSTPSAGDGSPGSPTSDFAVALLSGQVGSVEGIVTTGVKVTRRTSVPIRGDVYCVSLDAGTAPTDAADLHDGGILENAVVRLDAPDFPPLKEPITVEFRGCAMTPHTQGALLWQPLSVRNQDDTVHALRIRADRQSAYSLGPKKTWQELPLANSVVGPVRLTCDVHPWEEAWVLVANNPFFAVTDAQGHYRIDGVPPGLYVAHVWHPLLPNRKDTRDQTRVFRVWPGQVTPGDIGL